MTTPGTAELMDGTEVSRRILHETAERAREFSLRAGRRPCLAAVLSAKTSPRSPT
jgi:hypothetical protein